MALLHYPVLGKTGETIASAITNLDLHDIARASKTYGVQSFQVIIPLDDQRRIAQEICEHWTSGPGSRSNPHRKTSFDLIQISPDIESALNHICQQTGSFPQTIATSANIIDGSISYTTCRQLIQSIEPNLLIFGTAWGIAPEFMDQCDYILKPIQSQSSYNHLSVRSAVSIVLDRLVGTFERFTDH
ncbi:MAG: RNA methyltransferase [Candidatus Magnetomorum sp.]|nr:RNA methyltransferase [Candidatus Magnetomorum sp.]